MDDFCVLLPHPPVLRVYPSGLARIAYKPRPQTLPPGTPPRPKTAAPPLPPDRSLLFNPQVYFYVACVTYHLEELTILIMPLIYFASPFLLHLCSRCPLLLSVSLFSGSFGSTRSLSYPNPHPCVAFRISLFIPHLLLLLDFSIVIWAKRDDVHPATMSFPLLQTRRMIIDFDVRSNSISVDDLNSRPRQYKQWTRTIYSLHSGTCQCKPSAGQCH